MKDMMKKVVILDNLASPYVHQAIIVMRDYDPRLENRAVMEAERIVSAYLDNMKLNNGRRLEKRARRKTRILLIPIIAAAAAAALYMLFGH